MVEWFETEERWYPSKWGENDELGTLNVLSSEKVLKAIRLVKKGRVYLLAHQIFLGMPMRRTGYHGPFFYMLTVRPYDHKPPIRKPTRNKFGSAICRLELVDHLATHIDALNHISYDNKLYNGIDAFEVSTPSGTLKLGIEKTPPIVSRGVLVDIAGFMGVDVLEQGYAITVKDTEKFLKDHNLNIERGDVVLFNTGVSKFWEEVELYEKYLESSPGVGYELAKWLAERDVAAVGSDAPATEVTPPELEETYLPVHQYLITKCGIRIIDRMCLREIAADKVYEFLFVCAPLPIRGATASPAAPLAIV